MKKKADILAKLNKRKQPDLPDGFFDEFEQELMEKIREIDSPILSQLKKSSRPPLPEDYFSNLIVSTENEDFASIDSLSKTAKPTVPSGYFDTLPFTITSKIEAENQLKQQSTRIIRLKWVAAVASAAAIVLICLNLINFNSNQSTMLNKEQLVDLEQTNLNEADYLLSYIDEFEMVEYILDENSTTNTPDVDDIVEFYDYSEEELTEMYLDF